MPKLPSVSGAEAVRAFERLGFRVVRITGSHHVMEKPGHPLNLAVPVHKGKNLKTGLLHRLIRTAGVTADEFLAAL
jgi:predicted RNA binding protein YcfA (HicA-like mRNA interferase family)